MSDHLTGEVIGFRQWYVTADLELRAAHKSSQTWIPGENRAVCVPNVSLHSISGLPQKPKQACPDAPGHDCECGLYALHDPSDFWYGRGGSLNSLTNYLSTGTMSDPLISGAIAAWGNIEVHHQGFRAQYARVVALTLPEGKREAAVARAVAAVYGVPVVDAKRLTQIAGEFGSTVPVELRPEKPELKNNGLHAGGYITYQHYKSLHQQYVRHPSSWYTPIGSSTSGIAYDTSSLPWTPEDENAKAPKNGKPALPKRKPTYDPRQFIPKRKGGLA